MSYKEDIINFDELIECGPYTEQMPYPGKCYGNNFWTCSPSHEAGTTIQQYAEQHFISYEAARRQVKRYRHLLIPHIRKIYNTQFLDDQAVELLESHLRPKAQPEDTKQVRTQIKKLSEDMKETRINLDIIQNLNQEIGSLKIDNEHLKNTADKLEEDLNKYKSSYEELLAQYNELKIELVTSHEEIKRQQESIQQLNKLIANLEEKSDMFKRFQKILERQIAVYKSKLNGEELADPLEDYGL